MSAMTLPIRAEPQMTTTDRLGIIGAGKLGMALGRAAISAGYEVKVAGSGAAERIALTVDVLAPGAIAATVAEVVDFADLIVLAVPTARSSSTR